MTDDTVTRLADVRAAREQADALAAFMRIPALEPTFDLTDKKIMFDGSLASNGNTHQLFIVPFDISSGTGVHVCGLVFTKEQWQDLKRLGDGFFTALEQSKNRTTGEQE